MAAQNGWNEVAGHLLRAKKLNVNKKDLHANTALHLAAQNGQLGVSFGNLNFKLNPRVISQMLQPWEHAESHKLFVNLSELIQILVYFITLCLG